MCPLNSTGAPSIISSNPSAAPTTAPSMLPAPTNDKIKVVAQRYTQVFFGPLVQLLDTSQQGFFQLQFASYTQEYDSRPGIQITTQCEIVDQSVSAPWHNNSFLSVTYIMIWAFIGKDATGNEVSASYDFLFSEWMLSTSARAKVVDDLAVRDILANIAGPVEIDFLVTPDTSLESTHPPQIR